MLSLVLISIGAVFLLRELIRGRFGDSVVAFLTGVFHLDYSDALYIYEATFRNNLDSIIAAAIIVALIIVFRYSIRWVTEYFDEISSGCDALLDEKTELITLSPEMGFLELKLNESKTILEKRERDAREAEQRKNDLVVYLAHDLKTPLTSVVGYLTLLQEEPDLSPETRARYTGVALDKALRLEDLINEFFEITRFNLSAIELEKERVDVSRMLEQMMWEFKPLMADKGLEWQAQLPPKVTLTCDAGKMERVLDNIIRNAISYSEPGSPLLLTLAQQPGKVVIRLENRGRTIPPEVLSRLFERFYRADSTRATRSGGAGLGLAIAKEIVTRHGGQISAESYDNRVIFTVEMPAS